MALRAVRKIRALEPARADKQEKILAAAAAVFATRGYFGARVSDIADRARVADGTIYLYFRSKEEILVALFEMATERFLRRVRQELAPLHGAAERLRRLAFLHLDSLGSNRDLAIVFQVELRQSIKFMQRFSVTRLAEYFDIIRGVIREGQSQGVFRRELNEKLVTKCFFGALDEMATNWVLSQRQYRLADMAPAVADLFLRGMLHPSREDKGGASFPACAAGQAGMPAPHKRAVKASEGADLLPRGMLTEEPEKS